MNAMTFVGAGGGMLIVVRTATPAGARSVPGQHAARIKLRGTKPVSWSRILTPVKT